MAPEAEVVEAPPIPEAEPTPPAPELKTLTQEEVDAIVAEKDKAIADLAKENENIRKTQSKVDKELARLKSQAPTSISTQAQLRVLELLEEEASRPNEYDDPTAKQARLAKIQGIRNTMLQAQVAEQSEKIRTELHDKITEAGFDINDRKLVTVRAYFKQGLFDEARDALDEFLAVNKKEETVEKKEKSVDEIVAEKLAEEKKKMEAEILKKYNLAQQDISSPSGASSSFKKIEQDFAEGKINITQYKKARKDQGID